MNFWGEMTLNVTLLTFSVTFRKVVTQKGDWTCFFQTHQSNANHINNCATLFSSFSSTFSHMSFYNILWSGWHLLATVKSNLQLINMPLDTLEVDDPSPCFPAVYALWHCSSPLPLPQSAPLICSFSLPLHCLLIHYAASCPLLWCSHLSLAWK